MRMRKKKNLDVRFAACADVMAFEPKEKRGKWRALFGNDNPIHLEIGCGKGTFTVKTAAAHPDQLFVAVERVADCLLLAMEKGMRQELHNVVFVCDDAAQLGDMFAPGEVDRMYINFCDPWPSKKHAKRRLTYEGFLRSYRDFLKDGGVIEFKTDNRPLFDFSLTQFERAGYALSEVTYDLHKEYSDIIMTDYEARFVAEGVKIHRCVATKVTLPTELGEPPLLSLLDYLPDELDHIPYGMDNVLWENRGRVKLSAKLLAQLEGQPAESKGDEDS